MSFDFFDVPDEEEEIEEPVKPKKKKEKKPKEKCPYCGNMYVSVARHLPYCDENPENQEKEQETKKASSKDQTFTSEDEIALIQKIRKEMKASLEKGKKDAIPQLEDEEIEKIEEVMKFLGGTEGYQFLYKTITGDKIRGKMVDIIDECIEWLKKHKAYLLWYK